MCYQYGSVEHFTAVCPMCKVFKPSAAKCPHKKDICKNHAQDIVYLKNAEVQTFNGCGYCKWVKANPTKVNTHQNPGWAGCCRPPRENERVPPADWPAVAVVHNIPVPSEIRTVLESIAGTPRPATSSLTKAVTSPDRRTSPARPSGSPRAQPLAIPPKSRSPKEAAAQLAAPRKDRERDSPPTAESGVRRSVDGSSSSPSPLRRHVELENSIGRTSDRRSSVSRVPKANPDTGSGKGGHDPASGSPPSLRRRASNADARDREKVATGAGDRRAPDRNNTIGPGTSQASAGARVPKRSSLDIDFSGLAVSNSALSPLSPGTASSSDGGSSISGSGSSDGTVTSDGGFTDYLSDESEAELQRQAEARAALLAQAQVEDLEFKAARKQLAHVDLRPPKSWNPGVSRGQQQAVEVGYGRSR